MIYLDNAATTLKKPQAVADAVRDAIMTIGNPSRGTYEPALEGNRLLYETRELLNEKFNGDGPEYVAFTCNGTESLNIAIRGLFSPGDHVISTAMEHNSVLRPLFFLESQGMELSLVMTDDKGNISVEEMEGLIKKNTKGIVCTHASNLTGNMNDLKRIGAICKKHNLFFVVDASQTAGVFPIDMKEMNISALCLTGHKGLLGPQGTGALCVKKSVHIRPLKMGGSGILSYHREHPEKMPTALEAGTVNVHSIAGLRAALLYLKAQNPEKLLAYENRLMWQFYNGIKDIPKVKVYGDFSGKMRAHIAAMNIGDYDSAAVSDELEQRFGIATRPGAHCAPFMHQCLGTVSQGAVRFSFSHFTTEEEVKQAVKAVNILATED